MGFLRVVEVLPPLFPISQSKADHLPLEEKIERFVEGVRSMRNFADIFLVANVKNPALLKISTTEAAVMLQERLRVTAAPVIVVRDQNRPMFLSSVLTAIARELGTIMVVWGDDHPASADASNIRDFRGLSEAIHQASLICERARAAMRILAPVNVNRLSNPRGVTIAKDRLASGADILLAQPPTTDAEKTFETHASLLKEVGLKDRVLLNVFPFKDEKDVRHYESMFGWSLPTGLHDAATKGEDALLEEGRNVVQRLRGDGFPGVYLSTRGTPGLAEKLLS